MRRDLLRLLAAVPLLGACSGPSPLREADLRPVAPDGLPSDLPAPMLRVGDEWRYVMRSELTGLTTDRVQLRVSAVDAGGYQIAGRSQEAGPFEVRYDRDLNIIRSRGSAFQPPYPRFAFPLAIGKSWRADVTSTLPAAVSDGAILQSVSATAQGWERVTVPAGTFTALRVVLAINWRNVNYASVWGSSGETFWYAAQVRNAVLHHRVDYPHDGAQSNNIVTELESFSAGA
ncbi:MAG: hypothetical protein WCE38_16840 [Burkholderiales bacterium]